MVLWHCGCAAPPGEGAVPLPGGSLRSTTTPTYLVQGCVRVRLPRENSSECSEISVKLDGGDLLVKAGAPGPSQGLVRAALPAQRPLTLHHALCTFRAGVLEGKMRPLKQLRWVRWRKSRWSWSSGREGCRRCLRCRACPPNTKGKSHDRSPCRPHPLTYPPPAPPTQKRKNMPYILQHVALILSAVFLDPPRVQV